LPDKKPVIFIIALTVSRLIMNMTRRFAYPFASQIAAQLGVPLEAVQNIIALQAGVGIASPMFGPLSERYGRKWVMLGGMLLMVIVSALGAVLPNFWVFAVLMLAFGVIKMIFDPALLAYVGDRIPYNRRALAVGTTELSWAGSLFIIAPLAGFLIQGSSGVQAVFAVFTVFALLGALIIFIFIPADRPEHHEIKVVTPLDAWRLLRNSPVALAALAYSFLLVTAHELMFINYSPWMESSFTIQASELGIATTVIAVAEVLGEFIIIGFADRLGKRQMALLGALLAALGYAVLPSLAFSLWATLAGLFLIFLFVEIAIVASIPMFTEILPQSRAVMISSNVSLHSLGRLTGGALGSFLLRQTGSFTIVCLIATAVGLAAFMMMWRFVHETAAVSSL
jgi:DHA1 family inner membrane transport protein